MNPSWIWKPYNELTLNELYKIIAVRERVFVVEQKILYVDADGLDPKASHLFCLQGDHIIAYLRAFAPGVKFAPASFGRVLTAPSARGQGLGKQIVAEALLRMARHFGPCPIKISAQAHLKRFYEDFGFVVVGDSYEEEGILHIAMVRE